MWITPTPSFARLPGVEPRSSSSSPSLPRSQLNSRPPSADLITSKTKKKKKGKGKESPSSSGSSRPPREASSHKHAPSKSASPPPLPHEEDAGPSGFGTANEDYNTLTEEYLQAAMHTGYDGRVRNVENEGPLVEGSKAWEREHEVEEQQDEGVRSTATTPSPHPTPPYVHADEENVWAR